MKILTSEERKTAVRPVKILRALLGAASNLLAACLPTSDGLVHARSNITRVTTMLDELTQATGGQALNCADLSPIEAAVALLRSACMALQLLSVASGDSKGLIVLASAALNEAESFASAMVRPAADAVPAAGHQENDVPGEAKRA